MLTVNKSLIHLFPIFQSATANTADSGQTKLLQQARLVEVDKNTILFHQGDQCLNYYFLLEGVVKVLTSSAQGREVLLYRIKPGETCVLSTNCLLSDKLYPAIGITETPCKAVSVPAATLRQLLTSSTELNQFFLQNFSSRVSALIDLVSEVALERLDVRLARHLIKDAGAENIIHATHDQLAQEIGTAREVISRQLRNFEKQGWISTVRGQITLLNKTVLTEVSHGYFE